MNENCLSCGGDNLIYIGYNTSEFDEEGNLTQEAGNVYRCEDCNELLFVKDGSNEMEFIS